MRVKVLFFGMLKDISGRSQDELELPAGSVLGDAFDSYATRLPKLRAMESSVVVAQNHEFRPRSSELHEGDEVAFLPPVSGGSDRYTHQITDARGHFFALTRGTIDTQAVSRSLLRGEDGAIIAFEGVVRNNSDGRTTRFLDYECYEAMAVKTMAAIGTDIAGRFEIGRIALVHRLGRLEIGEASVLVLVTAPHRRPAFEAGLEAINRLKRLVPIWKKEYFADGAVWLEGEWDESILQK